MYTHLNSWLLTCEWRNHKRVLALNGCFHDIHQRMRFSSFPIMAVAAASIYLFSNQAAGHSKFIFLLSYAKITSSAAKHEGSML